MHKYIKSIVVTLAYGNTCTYMYSHKQTLWKFKTDNCVTKTFMLYVNLSKHTTAMRAMAAL